MTFSKDYMSYFKSVELILLGKSFLCNNIVHTK